MPLLLAQDLRKVYSDGTQALRGVSFKIEKGEYVAIMGPSGSGKSTTIRCINHVEEQQQGRIVVDGIELNEINHCTQALPSWSACTVQPSP